MQNGVKCVDQQIRILERLKSGIYSGELFRANNKVVVSGQIKDVLEFSHRTKKDIFYKTSILCERTSKNVDFVPIIISKSLVQANGEENFKPGAFVEIGGIFKSIDKKVPNRAHSKLEIFLFVNVVKIYKSSEEIISRMNFINLQGYICKTPRYKKTFKREITEFILAVNDVGNKSYYFPCISWGATAKKVAANYKVGDKIEIVGRIQSREYEKRIYKNDSYVVETRIAYEISIINIIEC